MVVPSLKSKQNGSAHMIIIVIVVLAVIGGVAAYMFTSGFGGKKVTATTPSEVKDLLVSAKAGEYGAKCTYSNKNAEKSDAIFTATGTSTLYVSDKGTRIDATVSNKPIHMMQVDGSIYMWSDDNDKGSKFPIKEDNDTTDNFSEDAEKYQIECESADLDDSLFDVPTDVTFTEPKAQFQSSN